MHKFLRYPFFYYITLLCVLLALANLPLLGADGTELPSLEYLRQKHIEYSNYSNQKLNSYYFSGRIKTFSGEEAMDSVIKVFKKKPNKLKSIFEQSIGENLFKVVTVYDGKQGVRLEYFNDVINSREFLDGDSLKALEFESYIKGIFLRASEKVGILKVDGFETIKGIECVRLSVTDLGFHNVDAIWLRLDNFQEAKYRRLKKNSGEAVDIEDVFFSDYVVTDNEQLYAQSSEKYVNDILTYTFQVDHFKFNFGLFNFFFKIEEITPDN